MVRTEVDLFKSVSTSSSIILLSNRPEIIKTIQNLLRNYIYTKHLLSVACHDAKLKQNKAWKDGFIKVLKFSISDNGEKHYFYSYNCN